MFLYSLLVWLQATICIFWNACTDDLAVRQRCDGIRGNLNLHHRNDGFFRTGSSIIKPFQ